MFQKKTMNKFKSIIGLTCVMLLSYSCAEESNSKSGKNIVCTTGLIADAMQNILPKNYQISELMGPGVDPHTYKSKTSDLKGMMKADAIVYNGIHFEANLIDAIHNLEKTQFVVGLGNIVPKEKLRATTEFGTAFDPHFWHDVNLFAVSIELASRKFIQQFPEDSAYIDSSTAVYLKVLAETEAYVSDQMATIPDSLRVLVTAHDAFGYFGRAFNLEVIGVQGLSTASDISIRGITNLTEYIFSRKIPAIFVENSVSEKNIKSITEGCISKGHNIKQGGVLYSDGLGDVKSGASTYVDMIKANTNTIVKALK